MKITTNYNPRELLTFGQLNKKYQDDAKEEYPTTFQNEDYFIYYDILYAISDFMLCDIEGYHAVYNSTAFSGILINYCDENGTIIVTNFTT